MAKRVLALVPLIGLFAAGLAILAAQYATQGETWATNRANLHIHRGGAIAHAGTIYDRNNVVLAQTIDGQRTMPGSPVLRRATLHAVGDPQGMVATGAHTVFRSELVGFNRAGGLFSLIANEQGNDVRLSMDARLNQLAFEQLRGRHGTVGVMNYITGEVIVMVSAPSYDPMNKPDNMAGNPAYEGVYLNRLLRGLYTPGSIFKVITAYAALNHDPDVLQREFTCTGRFATGGGYVTCMAEHGTLDLAQAMRVSCNSVFAELAVEFGSDAMRRASEALGFNQSFAASGVLLSPSRYPMGELIPFDLGWAGIGQHTTLANPGHMMILMATIANGGRGTFPVLTTASAPARFPALQRTAMQIDPVIAARLRETMRGVTAPAGLQLHGKTGTAQVDDDQPHAWFVGFSMNPQLPYAIVVTVENAGFGAAQALPIATRVLQAMQSD